MSDAFRDVPSDLIRSMLARGGEVALKAAALASNYAASKEILRDEISVKMTDKDGPGIWHIDEESINEALPSEICAVDGAVVCDSRGIGDICAAVAVSLGTQPQNAESDVFLDSVPRSPANKDVTSAIMSSMEIGLAARAPGDVTLLDGALIATLINISKGIWKSKDIAGGALHERLRQATTAEFRQAIMSLLQSNRFMAVPKYVTKNDLKDFIPAEYHSLDARTVATMALRAGELTKFRKISGEKETDNDRQVIGPAFGFSKPETRDFAHLITQIHSCYYKPHPWTPAFRIDVPLAVMEDTSQLGRILRAIRDSTQASGLQEPLPQYLVDLFAKQISVGASAVVEMAAISSIDDPEARLLMAMGYRT